MYFLNVNKNTTKTTASPITPQTKKTTERSGKVCYYKVIFLLTFLCF